MVAVYETGDLVRSLVRVPGSGLDRTLCSKCLYLGNVSAMAASVPISALPAQLAQPLVQRQANKMERERQSSCASNESQHPKPQEIESSGNTGKRSHDEGHPPPLKKQRRVIGTGQPRGMLSTSAVLIGMPVQLQCHSRLQIQLLSETFSNAVSEGASGFNEATPSVGQLLQELSSLQAENATLNRKKRPTSVLKHLGVEVQC